jgi:hypothetical protein
LDKPFRRTNESPFNIAVLKGINTVRRNRQVSLVLAGAAATVIGLSGCSESAADEDFSRALASAAENLSWEPFPADIVAAMPSTRYVSGTTVDIALSDAVVTGKFVTWEPGKALSWEGNSDTATEVGEDDSPMIRRVVLELQVESVVDLRDGAEIGDQVTVTVPVDAIASVDAVGDGLVGLGDVVVYLTPFHDGGWGISLESTLVGKLMDDGTVDLPVLDAAEDGTNLNKLRSANPALTLADLEQAADEEVMIDISE